MRILVFAPHPDDDVIGCGGSIIKAARCGHRIQVVYLTSGEAGGQQVAPSDLASTREEEARQAAVTMGVQEVRFLREPDGDLRATPQVKIALIDLLRQWRPHLVYAPHPEEEHPDHAAAYHLVKGAVQAAAGPWYPEASPGRWRVDDLVTYEVWTPLSRVSHYEDTTLSNDTLMAALRCHQSQLASFPYEQIVSGLQTYRGAALGPGLHAEAFSAVQSSLSLLSTPSRAEEPAT